MNQFFNSKTVLALSAGLLLSLVPASATTAVFTPDGVNCANAGICSAEVGATTITFDGLGASTLSPYVTGIATFSFMNGSPFVNGSVSGEYAAPPNDNTDYLSVGSPNKANPVTVTFASAISYYGFYLGSPDLYNRVEFFDGAQSAGAFTGFDLLPPGDGDQSLGSYANFNFVGGSVNKIVFSSSSAAFETDNHAYTATPEPASMALAGAGLIGLVTFARSRRKA